jgi:hypothetical protein
MDHDALSDMGMSSLGHRLKVLRAVWEVKREQGIDIGEEDWKPAGKWMSSGLYTKGEWCRMVGSGADTLASVLEGEEAKLC